MSSVAVCASSAPIMAERLTSDESSSAVLEELSSSFGSIPKRRTTQLPTPLRNTSKKPVIQVKAIWKRITNLFVANGRVIAMVFGMSSPMRNENTVAITNDSVSAIAGTVSLPIPKSVSGPVNKEVMAGSAIKPVSIVVRVMPSCAPERCVLVFLRARIEGPRPFSPRSALVSRSFRSRFTSENSLATKNPVPIVRRTPRPIISHSFISINKHTLKS